MSWCLQDAVTSVTIMYTESVVYSWNALFYEIQFSLTHVISMPELIPVVSR